MENFDRENIDKLLEICKIRQYSPVKIFRRMVSDQAIYHLQSCQTCMCRA